MLGRCPPLTLERHRTAVGEGVVIDLVPPGRVARVVGSFDAGSPGLAHENGGSSHPDAHGAAQRGELRGELLRSIEQIHAPVEDESRASLEARILAGSLKRARGRRRQLSPSLGSRLLRLEVGLRRHIATSGSRTATRAISECQRDSVCQWGTRSNVGLASEGEDCRV